MIFDFNKEFKSNLIVESGFFRNLISREEFTSVDTENVEFNKKFNIFAEDEHEAFYILTPSFIEKIENIDEKIESSGIRFLFNNNKLHIGIYNHDDAFEFSSIGEISEEKLEANMEDDIKLIIELINDLNLTNDLFKR